MTLVMIHERELQDFEVQMYFLIIKFWCPPGAINIQSIYPLGNDEFADERITFEANPNFVFPNLASTIWRANQHALLFALTLLKV